MIPTRDDVFDELVDLVKERKSIKCDRDTRENMGCGLVIESAMYIIGIKR